MMQVAESRITSSAHLIPLISSFVGRGKFCWIPVFFGPEGAEALLATTAGKGVLHLVGPDRLLDCAGSAVLMLEDFRWEILWAPFYSLTQEGRENLETTTKKIMWVKTKSTRDLFYHRQTGLTT